jgi:hypothetical protein
VPARQLPPAGAVPIVTEIDSTFAEEITSVVRAHARTHFSHTRHAGQTPGTVRNALEDYALKLVEDVFVTRFPEESWTCLVAREGEFGLVGLDAQQDVLIVTMSFDGGAPGSGYDLYVFS